MVCYSGLLFKRAGGVGKEVKAFTVEGIGKTCSKCSNLLPVFYNRVETLDIRRFCCCNVLEILLAANSAKDR